MPSGDEGTGLHAFDDLDPISTVSALNVMPDDVDERPRMPASVPRSAPPPPPKGRRFSTLPMGGDGTSSGVRSTPPPPPFSPGLLPPAPGGSASGRSVPPPPPPAPSRLRDGSTTEDPSVALHEYETAPDEHDGDEDTRVVPNAYADEAEFAPDAGFAGSPDATSAQFEHFGDGATPVRTGGGHDSEDSDLVEMSATTVATNIDMDWDEEDVQTKLRDEDRDAASISGTHAPVAAPFVTGRPSPFPPPMPSPYSGNPSPFSVLPGAGYGGQSQPVGWESDEEAMTRVMSSPPLPPPSLPTGLSWGDSLAPASNAATVSGEVGGAGSRLKLAWAGVAAAALIGAALGARALLANAEPATVTIVTKPADAEVVVNGRPLTGGQSSPFTVQDLAPDQEHAIVIRKDGFAEQTHHFRLEGGEVKALPDVELAPLRIDTGFALTSVPEGADIYVDEQKLAATTPARITDLKPGLHVIRLERGEGYQPWETQVALASGQVIELPTARLVGGSGGSRVARVAAAPPPRKSSPMASSRNGSSSRRTAERTSRARRAPRAEAPVAAASEPVRFAPVPASPPKVSGAQGTLRLNSRPWSQVFVDGRMIGNTPVMNVPLSAGSHSIKLVNPQLGMTKHLKVKIQNGKATTKIVELME